MQTTQQYYYRQGKATTKAVIYTIVSVLLVAFAVFSFVHWELSFMFTDWHGYVLIIPYFMITLGIILSVFENFKKASMTSRCIPAFAVGEDCFVLYDNTGLANVIPFEECVKVSFKRTYSRIRGTQLYLVIKYHDRMNVPSTFKVDLSELDRPQSEIDKQLKKIYNNYKKEHNMQ